MKALAAIIIIMLSSFSNFSVRQTDINKGKEVFESKCAKYHGTDGTKGKWGAKNLQISRLADAAMKTMIENGKRIMPAWGKRLTNEEIQSVMDYIKTLRR